MLILCPRGEFVRANGLNGKPRSTLKAVDVWTQIPMQAANISVVFILVLTMLLQRLELQRYGAVLVQLQMRLHACERVRETLRDVKQ